MLNLNIIIPVSICSTLLGGGVVAYFLTHPEVLEKLLSFIFRCAKSIWKGADKQFVKYNIQSQINSFVARLNESVPNLDAQHVKLEWIDESISQEQFLKSGSLVIRMHRSSNQKKNIVAATFAFVSNEVVKKAKIYLSPFQKDAIDLFVSYKVLERAGHDIMDAFVQEYLRAGLEKESIDKLYRKFQKIDSGGLFFPVFITEMTFLGEKIFSKGVEKKKLFKEVDDLVSFLLSLSNRHTGEFSNLDHNGKYSKFAIRIVGKQSKIEDIGKVVYVRNIKPLLPKNETLYLIGNYTNKTFIDNVVNDILEDGIVEIYHKMSTSAKLRDHDGHEFTIKNYIVILRNKTIEIVA